jgi:hypothetical protein
MTAPIGTSANLTNGLKQLGSVTNTYAGYLQSAGAAYSLVLPFRADKISWWNYTTFATNTTNLSGVWFRDMPAGDGLIIARGTTTLTSTLETTNGVTNAATAGGYVDEHRIISGISAGVVTTSTAHGLVDGSRVKLTKIIGTVGAQLNNNTYVVDVLTTTTFKLYDTFGVPITQSGTWTSSGQVTNTGPELGIVNAPVSYAYTLGSAVMGLDNEIIYFEAVQYNNYVNLGDVA